MVNKPYPFDIVQPYSAPVWAEHSLSDRQKTAGEPEKTSDSVCGTKAIGGVAGLTLLASWPNWLWLAERMRDGSDEPWGIAALLTLLALAGRERAALRQPSGLSLAVTALFVVSANLLWGLAPPIFSTAAASTGLACLLAGLLPKSRPLLPLLCLCLLVLPLTASLNFYLGYPLRWFCAQASALLLELAGVPVKPEGAALLWRGKAILIDAPCAGIAMLWLGAYLAALFSYLNNAAPLRSCLNLAAAFIVVILANVLRNALLFFKESGLALLPDWTHEAIGLASFGAAVLAVYGLTLKAESRHE